ncbi:MAG: TonB-dependent receptor, partial [Gammaproteobacteria bacterium]|nr:TonB-dependent receptor [Gammaproteobacteria bacterium]
FLFNQYPPVGDASSSYFTDHQNNFTQEIRLSSADPAAPLQWTVGGFYLHANENSTEFIYSPDACSNPLAPCTMGANLTYLQPRFSMIDRQKAAFGEVSYKLSSMFKLTAGLRYSKLDYSGDVQEFEQGIFGLSSVNTVSSGSDKPLTPRFVFDFTPDSDSLYYVSAAKGFRPGGINTHLPPPCTVGLPSLPATFSSDSLWQYEIGTKDTLFDRRLQVSASAYYIKWKNIQQFVYLTCGLGFDYNLGELTGKGGDIEIDWRVTPDLTLGFTAAYTDSAFDGPISLAGIYPLVSPGDHLQASPWNTDLNLEYVWNALARKPYIRLDYQFATAQHSLVPFLDPANHPNDDPTLPGLPELRVLDIRAGVRFNGLDLSLFVHNALDYHTQIFASRDLATTALNGYVTGTGGPAVNFDTNYFARGLPPRTYGATLTYRF